MTNVIGQMIDGAEELEGLMMGDVEGKTKMGEGDESKAGMLLAMLGDHLYVTVHLEAEDSDHQQDL